jgi:hypothetical protein
MVKIEIAALKIALQNNFSHIESLACEYLTDGECDFTVSVTNSQIDRERKNSDGASFSDGYLESICLYREIAEKLPEYDAFVFHGCVMAYNGGAYLFTARSGVGKTTHAKNWLSLYGDKVHVLNGDKPVIRIIDGTPYAAGTPWRGKENYGVNEMLPLRAIVFLDRGPINRVSEILPKDATVRLIKQVYLPQKSALSLTKTMRLSDKILSSVRLLHLECTKDEKSAEVSFNALVND